MKTTLLLLIAFISILIANNDTIAQNCPGYSTTVTSPSVTCGNQPYYFQVANTACNGTITFNVVGNYGSSYADEISWVVTSNLTGLPVASGGPGTNNGAINVTVGPLNPAVTGNYFTLTVNDVFGDGFNGTGGTISITQSTSTLVGPITGNFGAQSITIFGANINISPVTVTITTPTGPVTTVVNNCEPINVPLTLQNNAFCSPTTVNLPWTITCNSTGAVLASGTKAVTVYPKIPTAASDLVQVSWNPVSCAWNVTPQNGCVTANIGTIFTLSPDPATLPAPVCGGGSQAFNVSYNGISGGPNCCSTGGPLVPITYTFSDNTPTAQSTPFGGTNNGAFLTIPPANNNGGNATAVTLNVNMSGYCFNPPGPGTNTSYWVTIYQNNNIILDQQSVAVGPSNYNTTLNLTQIPGYNASSAVVVYIYPNAFNYTTAGGVTTNTTFVQGIACPPATDGYWTASSISASLSATYQNLTTSTASCVYPIAAQSFSCCPFTTVPNATGVICAGGSLASLTAWQASVAAANPNCVVYSSVLPVAGTTLPNNLLPNGNNATTSVLTQTVSAYSYCDVNGSGTINSGDTYSLISTFTLTVNPTNTITLTSAATTTNQTLCLTNPITNITYTTTGATGATFTGLPTGVTGSWNNNAITIIGTPTQTGTFNYTVTLTGGCGSITATGTITIIAANTIVLSSAASTTNQTLCNPSAITTITYTTTGATGATFAGLPTGVTGTWNNNTVTISGTPSQTGTFNYTVTLTGGCGTITATGTLVINPLNTITLSSALSTTNQTLCSSLPITNITYTTTGATGATFTGLPNGVTGTWNNNNAITLSGTPTQTGTFNYTVTLTGGCGSITATGTITIIAANTIVLSSAASTTNQTLCSPSAITTITYTTTVATGATFAGLPTGVTGTWNNNTVTISGTPSQTGTFNYTVTLTGGCGTITATGTLVINPINTMTLSSALSTTNQTLCSSAPITNITYTTTGATGATFSGLPNGVTGAWNNNAITISGNPTQTGTFNYTITLTGGCGLITATGILNITQGNTLTLTSVVSTTNQIICSPNSITNITYTTTGATGATFTGLPTGVTGTWTNNTITISGTPSQTGTFNYTISLTGGCGNPTATGTITINSQTIPNFSQISPICSGGSISLPSSSLNSIAGVWSPTVNNLATTTYTFTPDVNQCATTATMSITVNPNVTPTFNQVAPLCSGIGFVLPSTSIEGVSGSWTPPLNSSSTTNYTFTPNSTVCTLTANMTVSILPLPNVNAGSDLILCTGDQATLSGSGAQTYSWTVGIIDLVPFIPVATASYTLTGTSVDGCIGTDQVTVTVNPIPNVYAGNDVTVCSNSTVVLTGSGAANYSWNNGALNGVAFTPPSGTTNYTVTGTSAAGCIATDNMNVTVINSLSVSFTPDVTTGCSPLTVNFTNNSPNGVNCTWTMGNGDVLNGCGAVSYTFTNPQCYDISLTVTDASGCVGTLTQNNLICVESNPIADFIASDYSISELNNSVQFNNQSVGATSYSWNFGDNSINSTQANPEHVFPVTEAGTYTVTLTAISDFGCISTTQANIQVFEELIFYVPNSFTPDNDVYNQMFKPIFTSGFDPFDYSLLIFNRWGEIVFESHDSEIGWLGTYGTGSEIKNAEDGTYTWIIEFKTSKNDERKAVRGHINLLR